MNIVLKIALPRKPCDQCIHYRKSRDPNSFTFLLNNARTSSTAFLPPSVCEKGIYLSELHSSTTGALMKFPVCSQFYSRYLKL